MKQHNWIETNVDYEGDGYAGVQITYYACLECGLFKREITDVGDNTTIEYFNIETAEWDQSYENCDLEF